MKVISNPTPVENEIKLIHSLFEEGLELFHIRKPDFKELDMRQYVMAIGLEFCDRLVLHSHHQLAAELGINRIHFTESKRKEMSLSVLKQFKANGFHLTTSTHCIEDFNALDKVFESAFLSPVYKSISKENYISKIDLFEAVKKRTNHSTQLIALGGIESINVEKTLSNGFDNIALLGTIWNSENPIKNYIRCQKIVLSF
ncbi:thiamine phosphate synthase [Flavobacterium sp. K5-23]|uniref:thiamine phosphate synthase n=1 Tax=Flavobacterium sp. K5-23 TaxID=2746225 RepID=UPI00200F87AE|nr:thiamine phosphate synthase [Flavobacterium sp. K5-23]UQD55237.1 thiamine phosphate synthase [Flavobacterium sp. K5-23]